MTMNVVLVAAGGALGSAARYLVDGAVYRWLPATFPYGTFIVNVTACLAFGLLLGVADDRLPVGSRVRALLLAGLLGGYSTFSTFAFETLRLLDDGKVSLGVVNAVGQIVIGVIAMWGGVALGRMLRGLA